MENKSTQECLDITKIKIVEALNSIDFSKYVDKRFKNWVRYIVSPVSTKALNEICELSTKEGSMVTLGWTMGELYYKKNVLPQPKKFKQTTLPDQK